MTNEDGTIGVVLNGEIYNFGDLRARLLRQGHELHTTGDTEVIAHLAEDLEPAALAAALDGMFAFALVDDRRGRLVLGRDAVGKKPLYYYADDRGRVVFGSELKAVLAHPAVPRCLDPDAIPSFLTFGYMPSPRTFYAGVRSLAPGSVLIVDRGHPPRIETWWTPPVPGVTSPPHLDIGMEEAAELVRSWLSDAVARRLVADVPLGAFLSGGIDSSAIVALMAGLMDRPVRTFSIGFDDTEGFDERPYARMVADRWSTDHTEQIVHPHGVELVERLVHHYDEPFGDSSAVPTFLLAEMTREHVTVALSGDGGDELFAGYERFSTVPALRRLHRLAPVLRPIADRATRLGRAGGGLRHDLGKMADRARLPLPELWSSWLQFLPEETVFALTGHKPGWALEQQRLVWDASAGADLLDRLLHLNLRTYLLDDLLPKADRMSMAHGLEVRSPFLDRTLIEQVATIPPHLKADLWRRKRVLRHAVADLLPEKVLTRPKHGFGVPLDRWFRTDLRTYFEDQVLHPGARLAEQLQPAGVRALWAEHQGGVSHGHLLWALLTLEVFLRRL